MGGRRTSHLGGSGAVIRARRVGKSFAPTSRGPHGGITVAVQVRSYDWAVHRQAEPSIAAAAGSGILVAVVATALVALFDAVLSARVRAGSDNALRLSVILPYLGVGSRYVLARALGLSALVLSGATVALGLERGRRRAVGMATSPVGGRIHRQASLVVIVLVVAHVVVPFTSSVVPYGGWTTVVVPFDQPFFFGQSAISFESLGIIALVLMVLLGPSYYLIGTRRRLWGTLHVLTVGAYGLSVLHALFLGSDFVIRGPSRVALITLQIPITVLLARRLRASGGVDALPLTRRYGALLAVLASAAVAVVALIGLAGGSLGGRSL
ncbi:MAG: Ferric reductase like transrane component [Acidimicrobiaceae bacterium]|nr:Ferric reductase like transrane component [Acidimicrobiaceae bacterium]